MNKLSSLQLWQSILCVITMLVQDAGMFDNVHYEIFGAVLLTTNMIIILMIAPVVVATVFRSLQEVTASIRRGSLGRADRVVLLTTRRALKKGDSVDSVLPVRVRSFTTFRPRPRPRPRPQLYPPPHPQLRKLSNQISKMGLRLAIPSSQPPRTRWPHQRHRAPAGGQHEQRRVPPRRAVGLQRTLK